jgi:Arm DNA-binding domain
MVCYKHAVARGNNRGNATQTLPEGADAVPIIKLTQPAVERLKAPASGRVEYWDSQLPGFGLRISESGRKTWVAMYRVGGKLIRETIGTAAVIDNVADARERARQSMQKAQSGISPVAERRRREQALQAHGQRPSDTFQAVATRYLERYAIKNTKPSTWNELSGSLKLTCFRNGKKGGSRPSHVRMWRNFSMS